MNPAQLFRAIPGKYLLALLFLAFFALAVFIISLSQMTTCACLTAEELSQVEEPI